MIRGVDGHGSWSTDQDGARVYKSDAEMLREQEQRKADALRPEILFVAEEYKVFFLTRQPGTARNGRNAYISVKPFNTLAAAAVSRLRAQATPWDEAASAVRISTREPLLVFEDKLTKTESTIYVGELDEDVRRRLRFNKAADAAWKKYDPDPAPATDLATGKDIPVGRPLILKKNSLSL